MEPATYDFSIYQGATWSRYLTYKTAAGVVVNLTGYAARMTIRRTYGAAAILALGTASPLSGITVAATSPNITITITATQTAALDFEYAVYDLEIESAGGVVTPLLRGRITLKNESTT